MLCHKNTKYSRKKELKLSILKRLSGDNNSVELVKLYVSLATELILKITFTSYLFLFNQVELQILYEAQSIKRWQLKHEGEGGRMVCY